MCKALLLIDLSNDFIKLDGALNCGQPGEDIIPFCESLVREFVSDGLPVIDARDEHSMEDYEISSGLFPPHNLKGTWGQELIPELAAILKQAPSQWIYIPKKHYNAMFQTDLPETLSRLGIDELHVIGVCTDICVRYTTNGLYEYKTTSRPQLRIVLHQLGVASFNQIGHEDSLKHLPGAFGIDVL